jgi:hypothetical protein
VIVPREQKVRPWAHVLLGGIHMFPQTAFSNNGFAAQLGGGADLRLRSWLWLRMEGDYIRSQLYTQGQNNFQIASSIVFASRYTIRKLSADSITSRPCV